MSLCKNILVRESDQTMSDENGQNYIRCRFWPYACYCFCVLSFIYMCCRHGLHIDNELDCSKHSLATLKRGPSRMFFLQRLRSFNFANIISQMFYESVVASVFFYAVVCWGERGWCQETERADWPLYCRDLTTILMSWMAFYYKWTAEFTRSRTDPEFTQSCSISDGENVGVN